MQRKFVFVQKRLTKTKKRIEKLKKKMNVKVEKNNDDKMKRFRSFHENEKKSKKIMTRKKN